MSEIKNITVLTNKMEAPDFSLYSEYGRYNTYLLIIFQTKIQFSYNGKDYFHARKNSVILYPPYQLNSYKSDDTSFLNSFIAFLTDEEYFGKFSVPLNTLFYLSDECAERIIRILDRISYIVNTEYDLGERSNIPKKIDSVMQILSDAYAEYLTEPADITSKEEIFSHIRSEMIKDPIKYTVREMVRLSGYTETYFGICYKKLFGCPPVRDRQLQIIKLIKNYLETTTFSMEKIAGLCSIESVSYMITMFKRQEKITPNQYRIRASKIKESNIEK